MKNPLEETLANTFTSEELKHLRDHLLSTTIPVNPSLDLRVSVMERLDLMQRLVAAIDTCIDANDSNLSMEGIL